MNFVFSISKGGTAKTTSAIMMAEYLTRVRSEKTLIIDLDPQSSISSFYLDIDSFMKKNLLSFLAEKETFAKSIFSINKNLDILPSSLRLSKFESLFADKSGVEVFIRSKLEKYMDKYKHIVIDTHSNIDKVVINALLMADYVIAPAERVSRMSFEGIDILVSEIKALESNLLFKNLMNIKEIFILPTMIKSNIFTGTQKKQKVKISDMSDNFPDCFVLPEVKYYDKITDMQDKKQFLEDGFYDNYKTVYNELFKRIEK